ncbi:hypothetical protein NZNM25_04940 [Nitrosopumilus zosterae]|uniref:Uncharacterized protein n=1 Tax=Nitrosopumilus zosterae TaxID=718286 RepID=A0A2S2KPX0_9ARCH|nr:hypothetical protein [Nitrosopumilus zosterae]BDQ31498.1 hypothetical protein NZOSNM25_001618 [Nitrosopumilus zosterae]GBH33703.1 hypothetical protein NZNM25_04940 [Nitrosopumilus zosterae]
MKIILFDDHMRINLNILEMLGSAKTSFYIPYTNIVSAFSEPPHQIVCFKLAGTNFPKLIELGTFLYGTQKQFCYIKRRKNNFLVLVLKSNFYSKIILEITNSEEIAKRINEKLGIPK